MKRCTKGNTVDIIEKAEADERAREAKSTQVSKDKANKHLDKIKRQDYKQIQMLLNTSL